MSLTLRFLASGDSHQSLCFLYRIGKSSASNIISETCEAIFTTLKDQYISAPKDQLEWRNIATEFGKLWNFPHVIGALDGKHIRIECPKLTGSLYHNYKGYASIVLLAICDPNYCFTLYDVGSYGSNNDCGILAKSSMGEGFEYGEIKLPDPQALPGCSFNPLPFYILGDDIFPLKMWLLKPFGGKDLTEEQQIYNLRNSRARRTIEKAFGILATRRKIFSKPIRATVKNTENYVLASLALHTLFSRIEAAVSKCFFKKKMRLLFEGGYYLRAASINFPAIPLQSNL